MLRSFIQKFCLIIFVFSFSLTYAKEDYQVETQYQVIEKAKQIEQLGVLKQKDNGYLYLDVSNDFIAHLLPLIDVPGKLVPPRHYTSKKGIGAHISVMYENEQIDHEIWEIYELGQTFTFQIKELRTVKLNNNGKMKKLWLIAVEAPELERLRESYGLPAKLKGHDFHVTIAYQIPGKAATSWQEEKDVAQEQAQIETLEELEAFPEAA